MPSVAAELATFRRQRTAIGEWSLSQTLKTMAEAIEFRVVRFESGEHERGRGRDPATTRRQWRGDLPKKNLLKIILSGAVEDGTKTATEERETDMVKNRF